jgi:uncharacterized membrane protein
MTEASNPPIERLVFFSDAAVAIALTLLILPLMESVTASAQEGLDAAGYLAHNGTGLIGFALSFAIIARFWRSHHRLFAQIEREVPGLFTVNMVWLAMIVLMPVATAIIFSLPEGRLEYAIYIGTMLGASVCLNVMAWMLRRHHEAWATGGEVSADSVLSGAITSGLLAAALLVALFVPGAGFWSLVLLFASRPIRVLVKRLRNHRATS